NRFNRIQSPNRDEQRDIIRRLVEIEFQQFQSNNTTYSSNNNTKRTLYRQNMECYKCKVIVEEGLDSDFEIKCLRLAKTLIG
ncbi:hypothetical protein DICPUDRAFT_156042, partial [Dictyostelium purpureum]